MKRWALLVCVLALAGCGRADTDPGAVATTSGSQPVTTVLSGIVGSPRGGDSFYPGLGNGGYDVLRYDLNVRFDPGSGRIDGVAGVELRAEVGLSGFYLDADGLSIASVTVNGIPAKFEHRSLELLITPPSMLAEDQTALVEVTYSTVAKAVGGVAGIPSGWFLSRDGAFVLTEPEGASAWFPANDHPSDKAEVTLTVTVPGSMSVVSGGRLVSEEEASGQRTFVWQMDHPVSPYLIPLGVGTFDSEEQSASIPMVNYFDTDLTAGEREIFRRQPEMLDYFVSIFGPYPFDGYGALVVDDELPKVALETQTRSTFTRSSLEYGEMVVAHELAHQWVGDAVVLADWSDIWLNEGFATYGQWLWLEHSEGRGALDLAASNAYRTLRSGEESLKLATSDAQKRELEANFAPPGSPRPNRLFAASVYLRGALTLHALRLEVGDEAFFEILKRYVADHLEDPASTDEFIAVASEVSGVDLDSLFSAWLEDELLPAFG